MCSKMFEKDGACDRVHHRLETVVIWVIVMYGGALVWWEAMNKESNCKSLNQGAKTCTSRNHRGEEEYI